MGTVSEVPEGDGDSEAAARERRIARSFQAYEDARTAFRESVRGTQVYHDALGNMIGSIYDLVRELHRVSDAPPPLDLRRSAVLPSIEGPWDPQKEEVNPYRLAVLVKNFNVGLTRFPAQGDRAEMIQAAAEYVQEQDKPLQDRLARHWDEQRRKLSSWDL